MTVNKEHNEQIVEQVVDEVEEVVDTVKEENESSSFEDYKKQFIYRTRKEELSMMYKQFLFLKNQDNANALTLSLATNNVVKVDAQYLVKILLSKFDIVKNKNNVIYVFDSYSKLFVELDRFLMSLLSDMILESKFFMFKQNTINLKTEITAILTSDSIISRIRKDNFAPKEIILTSDGKAVNFKTKEIMLEEDALLKYDFTYKSDRKLVNPQLLNSKELEQYIIKKLIATKIFNDWSDNLEFLAKLYKQIMFAAITGDNKEKFFLLLGGGGNGKSSFIELVKACVGEQFVVNANLHQFGDPHSINVINESTRLIAGDDAAKSIKLRELAVANLKSIVGGNSISLNRKFANNITIYSNAVMIQAANHIPAFFENDEAMASRLIAIPWGSQSFRGKSTSIEHENKDIVFNLKHMIKHDSMFLDIIFTDVFETIEDFKTFIKPPSVEKMTSDVLNDSDTVLQYIDDVKSSLDRMGKIPIKLLYHHFINEWCPSYSPATKTMKLQTFTKELDRVSQLLDFEYFNYQERFNEKFNPHVKAIRAILQIDDPLLSKDKQRSIKFGDLLSTDELHEIKLTLDDTKDLSDIEYQALFLLCHAYGYVNVMSQFSDLL